MESRTELDPPGPRHLLGPLLVEVRARPRRVRLLAAVVFAGSAGLVGLALWLQPDPLGVGTHRQLGLPPCNAINLFGVPCPTCGMTTSFAHTVRGQWLRALAAQPFAVLLALGTVGTALGSVVVLIGGRCWTLNWYRVPPNRVLLVGLLLFAGSWAYKIIAHLAPLS